MNTESELELRNWRYDADPDGIGWLTLDKRGTTHNTLSCAVIEELGQALDSISQAPPRALVLASGKPHGFILGADIEEFTRLDSEHAARAMIRAAHDIVDRLEALSMPKVAMINGHCLGGGLELALACTYRVAVNDVDARIGLPEVNLGIHPGFGGTARLIETIGAPAAMELMLTGHPLHARQAQARGVVDLAVPARQLRRASLDLLARNPARHQPPGWQRALAWRPLRRIMAAQMRNKVAARATPAQYPAPYALIDLYQQHGGDKRAMLAAEAESVAKLICSETARNLVRVFFLRERLKRLGKAADAAAPVRRVHVVGAGAMGGDIAAWCALSGLRVTLQDQAPAALARALKRADALWRRKLRDSYRVQAARDRLQPDLTGIGAARTDLVIEAIFEDVDAKQSVFKALAPTLKDDALLATNTSSIALADLAPALAEPDRLIGLHFFNPVAKMQLVEVVTDAGTAARTARRGVAFVHAIGRLPLPVKSSPGFLVNRILMPYLMEAMELYRHGMPPRAIDRAATAFGMPMGPIELADTVGLDVSLSVARNLTHHFGGEVHDLLAAKVQNKQLGKKSGRGFYTWKDGKPDKPPLDKHYQPPEDATERMVLRFLNEAVACLREGVVADADLLDAGVIFGTGFAPFRGGPIHYIRAQGPDCLKRRLTQFAERYGERFTPDPGWDAPDLNSAPPAAT